MMPSLRGFWLLQMKHFATAKQKCLGYGWFCVTTTSRPGRQFRPSCSPQIRFSSNKNKEWYDWYKRLRVHPEASEKELKNAFYKRAKVEHSDIDKTPGAKARFQNASRMLQETYENLCDASKSKQHDQERLERQKAATAEAARMMASHPSVADTLRAKWKDEEEALRAADEQRKREVRKKTQPATPHAPTHERYQAQKQRAKPQKTNGPGEGFQKPQDAKTKHSKEAPPKQQQRQAQPEETEESRRRQQKMEEEDLARTKAASKQKKIEKDADKKKAEKIRLQERVIIIRGLPPRTRLEDVFDPLVELAPGPVFRAKLWSNNMAEIEFCTDAAAREVLALAEKGRLSIKDSTVYNLELARSKNKLPVIGHKSRVLEMWQKDTPRISVRNESLPAFLKRYGLQVERIVEDPGFTCTSVTVRFASWTDAEKAMRLLAKYQPRLNVAYKPDPCGMKNRGANSMASEADNLSASGTTEQERTGLVDTLGAVVVIVLLLHILGWLIHSVEQTAELKARQERKLLALAYREQMIRRFYGPWKKGSGNQGPG